MAGSSMVTWEQTHRPPKRMGLRSTWNKTIMLHVVPFAFPWCYTGGGGEKELRLTRLAQALGPDDTGMEASGDMKSFCCSSQMTSIFLWVMHLMQSSSSHLQLLDNSLLPYFIFLLRRPGLIIIPLEPLHGLLLQEKTFQEKQNLKDSSPWKLFEIFSPAYLKRGRLFCI